MDTTTFVNSIRTKYPDGVASDGRSYKDIPDAELADKIVQKYPVYKNQITDYKPYQPEPQGMDRVAESVGGNIKDQAVGGLKKIKTSITGGADRMQEGVDQGGIAGAAKFGRAALETGLGAAAGAAQTIFSPLGGVIETGIEGLSEGAKALDDVTGNVMSDKIKELDQSHPEVLGKVKDLIAKHPQLATDAMDLLSIIGLKGGTSAVKQPLKKVVTEGVDATKGALSKVPNVVAGTKKVVTSAKDKVMNTGLSKTPEEILATPESQVHKLSAVERDYYKTAQKEKLASEFEKAGTMSDKEFAAKQAQLDAEHNAIVARTNTELAANTAKAEKEIADFTKEVEQTAYNKTLELKPKAVQALSNQSKTYRSLIEEDLAPHRDVPVTTQEVSDVVNNALSDNPAMAEKIKAQLKNVKNVGDLYEGVKGVKADTSKAGIRGGRVYTADDMARDKVISGLGDLMKEKGVDLSRANDFWRQWAPLRDKIVTKLKPFDAAGMETKTFSEILKSSGDDIHNQNFIKAFEDVLGEPITGETQSAMARLSTAQKAKVAAEVDAKMAIEEAKLAKKYGMETIAGEKAATGEAMKSAKGQAQEALKLKQFQIDRLAARRAAIKMAIKGTIGAAALYEGNKVLKETTGVGF